MYHKFDLKESHRPLNMIQLKYYGNLLKKKKKKKDFISTPKLYNPLKLVCSLISGSFITGERFQHTSQEWIQKPVNSWGGGIWSAFPFSFYFPSTVSSSEYFDVLETDLWLCEIWDLWVSFLSIFKYKYNSSIHLVNILVPTLCQELTIY